MRYWIVFSSLFFTQVSWAQETLRWYPDTRNFPLGECVRSHSPSGGENYVAKVKPEECRPEQTGYLWVRNACYEVDSATQGQAFGVREKDVRKCAPPDAMFTFDDAKRECWLVDSSGGSKFKAKLEARECRPPEDEIKLQFIAKENKLGGDCFEVHKTLGTDRWMKKMSIAQCRPAKVSLSWKPTEQFKGECWEIADTGEKDFADKVNTELCRPEKVVYRFDRRTERTGVCFEVDPETEGQRYALRVSTERCRVTE